MKYTNEQKRILSLCRKYKGVRVEFGIEKFCIYTNNGGHKFSLTDHVSFIEEWLKTNCELKQVGRPKVSVKPNRKVKKTITFTADQWSKVERIQREQGLKYASHAIGFAVEAFSETDEAYKKGYSDGYSEGYNQGYEDC